MKQPKKQNSVSSLQSPGVNRPGIMKQPQKHPHPPKQYIPSDPGDKRRKRYALTNAGRDLLPIVLEMMVWSSKHDAGAVANDSLVARAQSDRDNLIRDLLKRSAS